MSLRGRSHVGPLVYNKLKHWGNAPHQTPEDAFERLLSTLREARLIGEHVHGMTTRDPMSNALNQLNALVDLDSDLEAKQKRAILKALSRVEVVRPQLGPGEIHVNTQLNSLNVQSEEKTQAQNEAFNSSLNALQYGSGVERKFHIMSINIKVLTDSIVPPILRSGVKRIWYTCRQFFEKLWAVVKNVMCGVAFVRRAVYGTADWLPWPWSKVIKGVVGLVETIVYLIVLQAINNAIGAKTGFDTYAFVMQKLNSLLQVSFSVGNAALRESMPGYAWFADILGDVVARIGAIVTLMDGGIVAALDAMSVRTEAAERALAELQTQLASLVEALMDSIHRVPAMITNGVATTAATVYQAAEKAGLSIQDALVGTLFRKGISMEAAAGIGAAVAAYHRSVDRDAANVVERRLHTCR